jgi:hypothetical protein
MNFLDHIQPGGGWTAIVGIRSGDVRQVLVSTREEAEEAIERYLHNQRDVYFGVAKYATENGRTKENVQSLKAFWLDIDCGEGKAAINVTTGKPGGYIDQATGLAALRAFCEDVGLPAPTLVNSGRGLHVYWTLTEPVTRAQWEPVAARFRDVCHARDFYVDDKVFEVARILRVPDTLNFKDDPPTPVSLMYVGKPIPFEDFRSLFGVAETQSIFDPNYTPTSRDLARQNGVGYSFRKIMQRTAKGDGCNQLLNAYANRATVDYYTWFYAISVAAMCEDAETATHMLSEGHPDYDRDEVDRKVATLRKSTSCAKFKGVNPQLCEGCPHFGKIMGPRDLGAIAKVATTDTVEVPAEDDYEGEADEADEAQAGETIVIPPYPFPFYRSEGGGVWRMPPKDMEEAAPFQVYRYDLYPIKIMDDSVEGNMVLFRLHLPHHNIKEFTVPLAKVLDPTELRKALSAKGVISTGKRTAQIFEFVALMLEELQVRHKEQVMRQQFGWADNNSKFIIGTQEIGLYGTTYSPPSKATKGLAKFMGPVGTLERWKEVWALYNTPGMELHAFAALSAFGSPLLKFLNQTGAVINLYSPYSGTGKTTVLNMVNSVYGHPHSLRLKQLESIHGRLQWVGVLNNLPPTMDELTNMRSDEYSDFLYALSLGRGKERMLAGANELRENNTTWQSITVSTANSSFAEKLTVLKNNPEGELMRLIEYPINKVPGMDSLHNKHMFDRVLLENHGHAGPIYIRHVLENMELVQTLCTATQDKIDRELQLESKERFWSATLAANMSGLMVATDCGLLEWDVKRIYKKSCDLIDNLRQNGSPPATDVRQVVADYLYRNMQNILVIDGEADARTNAKPMPKREPKGELLIRIEPDTKRMFLIAKSFKEHCVKFQINYAETIRKLETEGRILDKRAVRLSKGTPINGEPIHCLWFKIDDDFIDADQYAEGPKADAG